MDLSVVVDIPNDNRTLQADRESLTVGKEIAVDQGIVMGATKPNDSQLFPARDIPQTNRMANCQQRFAVARKSHVTKRDFSHRPRGRSDQRGVTRQAHREGQGSAEKKLRTQS